MKNQWRVIVGLVLVLVIVVFAVLNNQSVPVNFGIAKISGPLILIILGSAIIGVLVGLITSVTTILNQKKQIKALIAEKETYKEGSDKLIQEAVERTQRSNENQLAELQQKYQQLLEEKGDFAESDAPLNKTWNGFEE
ncbi:LapA family protein [Enterococcus sp. LJL51]|uniref:LapA family protein n=1 Tax=Enterococcus sp. LJL51 TaxID=3416656 RepID=UPI003CF1E90D